MYVVVLLPDKLDFAAYYFHHSHESNKSNKSHILYKPMSWFYSIEVSVWIAHQAHLSSTIEINSCTISFTLQHHHSLSYSTPHKYLHFPHCPPNSKSMKVSTRPPRSCANIYVSCCYWIIHLLLPADSWSNTIIYAMCESYLNLIDQTHPAGSIVYMQYRYLKVSNSKNHAQCKNPVARTHSKFL